MTIKRAFFNVVPGYSANSEIYVAYVRYDPHTTAGWRLIILPLWHAILRHPAGNISLPEGEPCMITYICEIFVCFRTYLCYGSESDRTPLWFHGTSYDSPCCLESSYSDSCSTFSSSDFRSGQKIDCQDSRLSARSSRWFSRARGMTGQMMGDADAQASSRLCTGE